MWSTQRGFLLDKAHGLHHQYRLSNEVFLPPAHIIPGLISRAVYFQLYLSLRWGLNCCTVLLVSEGHLQTAVMPKNFVSFGIHILLLKCKSNATSEDCHTDPLPFQVYVSSYIALLNAPYYMQPKGSETVNISEFRAHRPTLHSTSESDNPQETRKDGSRHPYDHDDQLHPTRPLHAVMVSSCITVDRKGLNDTR
jgi:hypothetical protein